MAQPALQLVLLLLALSRADGDWRLPAGLVLLPTVLRAQCGPGGADPYPPGSTSCPDSGGGIACPSGSDFAGSDFLVGSAPALRGSVACLNTAAINLRATQDSCHSKCQPSIGGDGAAAVDLCVPRCSFPQPLAALLPH
jgi:hypothetical protein